MVVVLIMGTLFLDFYQQTLGMFLIRLDGQPDYRFPDEVGHPLELGQKHVLQMLCHLSWRASTTTTTTTTTTTIPFSQTASAETVIGTSEDDKIKTGEGDDHVAGGPGADKINCGKGEDNVLFFNEAEGDKATGNCETGV